MVPTLDYQKLTGSFSHTLAAGVPRDVAQGILPDATRISMQTETRSQSPGGRYDNSPL